MNLAGGAGRLIQLCLVCLLFASDARSAETAPTSNATTATAPKPEDPNSQDTLRSILKLQEQLSATQLAIERSQEEADAAAIRRAEAVDGRLRSIEQSMSAQRSKELETIQNATKIMINVASVFGGLGCVAMLLTVFFQWRTVNRLTELASSMHALPAPPTYAALGNGDAGRVSVDAADQSSQRLLGALDRLEKRILELEHTARPNLHEVSGADHHGSHHAGATRSTEASSGPDAAQITLLLGKGQSLLNLDQNEEALACFDQVLALDANHPEALVKKGAALERLRKLEEAIVCYDRAIAADSSMTVAYLYKGGLFNRLERFTEALECYEKALHTQENRQHA